MEAKAWWKSRTLLAIVATAAVLGAEQVAPQRFQGSLGLAQQFLVLSGLWFARLGAGRPIGGGQE